MTAKHLYEMLVMSGIQRLFEQVLRVKERRAAGIAFEAASEPGSHIRPRLRRFAGTTLPPEQLSSVDSNLGRSRMEISISERCTTVHSRERGVLALRSVLSSLLPSK